MATAQSRRSRDEEETIDEQGRKHDSRGRFTSGGGEESANERGENRYGNRSGRSTSRGQSAGRIITRAVRVLDEIESRLAELREELEQQKAGSRSNDDDDEEGEEGQVHGRGFAGMDEAERREIARKGGRTGHERGTAHEWDEEEAREASRSRHR